MLERFNARLFICLIVASIANAQADDSDFARHLKKAVQETPSFNDRFEAEVWLSDMAKRLQNKTKMRNIKERFAFLQTVHTEAHRVNLPPELILAVVEVESNFDRWALSSVGARGLMQIMPFWGKELGKPSVNLFSMQENVRFGCTILRRYLDKEKGNLVRALGRYNGSLGSYRYPQLVMSALRDRWHRP